MTARSTAALVEPALAAYALGISVTRAFASLEHAFTRVCLLALGVRSVEGVVRQSDLVGIGDAHSHCASFPDPLRPKPEVADDAIE